jgi:hypothetical protein
MIQLKHLSSNGVLAIKKKIKENAVMGWLHRNVYTIYFVLSSVRMVWLWRCVISRSPLRPSGVRISWCVITYGRIIHKWTFRLDTRRSIKQDGRTRVRDIIWKWRMRRAWDRQQLSLPIKFAHGRGNLIATGYVLYWWEDRW